MEIDYTQFWEWVNEQRNKRGWSFRAMGEAAGNEARGRVPDRDEDSARVERMRVYLDNAPDELITDLEQVLGVVATVRYYSGVRCVVLSSALGQWAVYHL